MRHVVINYVYILITITSLHYTNLEAKTFAMVIGIDQYRSEESLEGAVNDAKDIARALQSSGANTQLFLNHAATKKAIKTHWERMVRASSPNDILVVTYAGHGSQIPDHSGDERDGTDEVFILSNYHKKDKNPRQYLISDDEWGEWFSQTKGRTILFVVDSCHSGTADKGSLANRFKQRSIKIPAPPFSSKERKGRDNNPNVLIISATTANRSIYEIFVNGKKRGALSWAFSTAIRGKSDTNKNGVIEKSELEHFVRTEVQKINHGQTPLFQPRKQFNNKKILNSAKLLSPASYQLSIVLTRINDKKFNIALFGNQYPYLTFYNITEKGIIQFLYPHEKHEESKRITGTYNLKLELDNNTLGDDQLVAIFSGHPQERLNRWLSDWNQQKSYHNLKVNRPSLLRNPFEEIRLNYRSH